MIRVVILIVSVLVPPSSAFADTGFHRGQIASERARRCSQPSQSRAMASPIACGVSDLHHSYITHGAITCNGRQTREKKPAYLSGFCKCVQSLGMPRISLVAGAGKRFESARRLSFFC